MKKDKHLKKEVEHAIRWEPLLGKVNIGVKAKHGIITLSGTVDSDAQKKEAEDAVNNVDGVKELVEKIEIKLGNTNKTGDTKIASEAMKALGRNCEVPEDLVNVTVKDGHVTLEGELKWNYQKRAAKKSIKHLMGIKNITNNITIKPVISEEN